MIKKVLILIMFVLLYINGYSQDKSDSVKVQATIGYNTDLFFAPTDRAFHVYTVGAGYKGPKTSLLGLYNMGDLTTDDVSGLESQYELDFYHKLSKKTYYWLNYAYSNDQHFPNHRVMARIWQDLGAGFGTSVGSNYYYVRDTVNPNILMANIGLEKYMGNFWIEGRTIFFFKEPSTKYAFQLTSRVFIHDVNYIELMLMTGAAPDEPWRTGITEPASNLKAHSIMARTSTYLSKQHRLQLKAAIGYSYEEYKPTEWRNRYVGGISLIYNIF